MKEYDYMVPGFQANPILDGKAVLVSIDGQVPADAMSEVSEELSSAVKDPCKYLIIDCSRLTRITKASLGLGLVAYYASVMKQKDGELVIVLPSPEVMSQMEGKQPMNVVRLMDSTEKALEHVSEKLQVEDGLAARG